MFATMKSSLSGASSVRVVRLLSLVEGLSWLLLLFVAMPLKYGLDLPLAVRIAGSLHGLLFVLLVSAVGWAHFERRWPSTRSALVLLAALVPFGFLLVDRTLREEAQDRSPGSSVGGSLNAAASEPPPCS